MKDHPKYLLVDSQILPEVYLKVILAKKLLAQGKGKKRVGSGQIRRNFPQRFL